MAKKNTRGNPVIGAWLALVPKRCMFCGCGCEWPGLQVHHIARRSHAPRSPVRDMSYNLLLLCERCHSVDFAAMTAAKQLCVKKLIDPQHYDLQAWLKIKDPELKAPLRVTEADVLAEEPKIKRRMTWIKLS